MKYFESLEHNHDSFEDRVGDPQAFDAAVGLVAIAFAYLEDSLGKAIGKLLDIDSDSALALAAEMSFRNKMHLFSSVSQLRIAAGQFPLGDEAELYLRELVSICFKAEELRNGLMHSSWVHEGWLAEYRSQLKVTAKAARGLHRQEQRVNAADIMDIHDYTIYAATMLDELMGNYPVGPSDFPPRKPPHERYSSRAIDGLAVSGL